MCNELFIWDNAQQERWPKRCSQEQTQASRQSKGTFKEKMIPEKLGERYQSELRGRISLGGKECVVSLAFSLHPEVK